MRTVPGDLQSHLDQPDTTTCRLLKIMLKNGTVYGLTTLDRDVRYDDGAGEVTYVATNGFDPSDMSDDIGYSVANAQGYALISNDIPGITIEMVRAGELDDAQWICYLVNYENEQSDGSLVPEEHVLLGSGDMGEVFDQYGMIWTPEILSYIVRLRQPIGSFWSRTCRAVFGTPATSQTGCGVDLTALWANGEVTAVGSETDREFTGDVMPYSTPSYPLDYPARFEWITGDNSGIECSVEEIDGNVVTLNETTPYPIQVGDTYRTRRDCRKRYQEDCIDLNNNGPNFKGEPLIPVGDASQVQTPGAQLPGGGGYTGGARASTADD